MIKFIVFIILLTELFILNNLSLANYDQALKYYNSMDWKKSKEECEKVNNGMCLNLLGLIYLRGLGVETNYEKSFEFFTEAEKMGNKKAMINLGIIYMKGFGKEVNMKIAAKYFNKAFENIISKNYSEEDKKDSSNEILLSLSNNSIIARYAIFYTNFLKFNALKDSEIGKYYIKDKEIKLINNKVSDVNKKLSNFDIDLKKINSQISEEQDVLLMLFIASIKDDKNKFEYEVNNVISYINNFSFK